MVLLLKCDREVTKSEMTKGSENRFPRKPRGHRGCSAAETFPV